MVTDTSDTQNIHTVQTLLDKLDKLKNEGASPLERIRVIQEDGGNIIGDEFSMEEAFDVERRHRSERQKKLVDLRDRVSTLASFWEAAPLAVEINGAGKKLLSYLTDFVDRAEHAERKKEILELSDLWQSAPDVSEHFGCVPITPQRTSEAALRRQEERLKKEKAILKAKMAEVEAEVEGPLDVKLPENGDVKETARKIAEMDEQPSIAGRFSGGPELSKDFLEPPPSEEEIAKSEEEALKMHEDFINKVSIAKSLREELKDKLDHLPPVESLEEPEDEDGKAAWHSAKKMEEQIRALDRGDTSSLGPGQKLASKEPKPGDAFWDGENVRKFPIKKEYDQTDDRTDEIPFEGDRLTGEAWAMALTEVSGEQFTFRLCGKSSMGNGHIGMSMLWERGADVSRLDIYEESGRYHLGFQFRSAKWENRNVERILKSQELRAMHADPKKWLEDALPLIPRRPQD